MKQSTKIKQILENSRAEIKQVVQKAQIRQCEKGYFYIDLVDEYDPKVFFIPKLFPMTNPIYMKCKALVENSNLEQELVVAAITKHWEIFIGKVTLPQWVVEVMGN